MVGLVVLLEQVLAEVARDVAPYRVDVICVILRVIHFNEKQRRLNAIIVRVTVINATRTRRSKYFGQPG